MHQNKYEANTYEEDQISLRELFNTLMVRKFLIAGLTIFATVLTFLYTNNITPSYLATSNFTSPSESSVVIFNSTNYNLNINASDDNIKAEKQGNKVDSMANTKDSIFSDFLNTLSSKTFQSQALIEGGFLTKFNPDNIKINDVDLFISSIISSVKVIPPQVSRMASKKSGALIELPFSVSIQGSDAEIIAEFLDSLIDQANSSTVMKHLSLLELKTSMRLEEISLERELLLDQAKQERLNRIKRIKEEDGQKIRQITDRIKALKISARQERLNQIEILTDAAILAKYMGIIENNFKINNDSKTIYDFTIAINESIDLPDWYLYGEKALLQRIELLKNRKNDDPFIPELISLNSQLNEVQNNNLLKTLEARQDDGPFISKIVKLNNEAIKLKSRIVRTNDANAMQLSQSKASLTLIDSGRKRLLLLVFLGSLMISILLAFIMKATKPNNKIST